MQIDGEIMETEADSRLEVITGSNPVPAFQVPRPRPVSYLEFSTDALVPSPLDPLPSLPEAQ